ncbi:P-loop containing nucleoside triphosphate hydrolase protein [Vararia minispora EC-137]|uniref:P-loop containing nucleoside triphosphate hydrolase protein n=1 Tax=Vararia minispora EC-137 TaxID=1314806 RepID=A0ACB8QJA0_9AGAM|nr:P-loop containing nucleoside triphosphate hydrolase protein [Vararia minispora EC-137]
MPEPPLLAVKDVASTVRGHTIFSNASFTVNEGDIIALRARSGAGKSTLLKCLSHLGLYQGTVLFRGKTPKAIGVPTFRTLVTYVPQRPSLLPGTPRDLVRQLGTFRARASSSENSELDFARMLGVARKWGLDDALWDRPWNQVSGGEAQRIALAIGFGCNTAEVLLLDEPTSALDTGSALTVEETMVNEVKRPGATLKAIVWITHSDEQAVRVATRYLKLTANGIQEESSVSPSRLSMVGNGNGHSDLHSERPVH